ncbi:MAG: hypothetical protein ABJJ37_05360 [Roseibium sp.]
MGNSHHHHGNETDIDIDVDIDVDHTATYRASKSYLDDDTFDIDLQDDVDIDQMLVSKGAIDFSPGDDISVEDALNDALNGAGNDAGVGLNNTNQLYDNDKSYGTKVENNDDFTQVARATGGTATADDGIDSDGIFSVWAGDDGSLSGSASAAANASNNTDAFINELVQGANIANNSVDMTVVGGNMFSDSVGEDDA